MSGLELVGSLGAILQIAGEAVTLSQRFRRCCKNLKHARREVETVREQFEMFGNKLTLLHDSVEKIVKKQLPLADKPVVQELVVQIKLLGKRRLEDIATILKRLKPLRADKNGSRVARAAALLAWLFLDRVDLKEAIAGMYAVSTSIDGFWSMSEFYISLDIFEQMREQNREVPADLTAKIRVLEAQLKAQAKRCEEAQRKYENLKRSLGDSEASTQPVKLVTQLVQQLVQEELAKARSIRREDYSAGAGSRSRGPPAAEQPTIRVAPEDQAARARRGERLTARLAQEAQAKTQRMQLASPSDRPSFDAESTVSQGGPSSKGAGRESSAQPDPMESNVLSDVDSVMTATTTASGPSEVSDAPTMFVIHDDGKIIREQWRRPRKNNRIGKQDAEHDGDQASGDR